MSPLTQGPIETDYQKLHRLTPTKAWGTCFHVNTWYGSQEGAVVTNQPQHTTHERHHR